MSDEVEARNRRLLAWALRKTCLLTPPDVREVENWTWDADDACLRFQGQGREWQFHISLCSGGKRAWRDAFLGVFEASTSATWEASIPPEVYEAALSPVQADSGDS